MNWARLFDIVRVLAFRMVVRATTRDVMRVGSEECGWYVPVAAIDASWICYVAGVGEDATFDVALADLGCEVVAIDPTPRAITHIRPFVSAYPNLHLAPYALWTSEGDLDFFPPSDPAHVSFSATNLHRTGDPMRVAARTLPSVMREFGHSAVHLLKLDIEGAEALVVPSLNLDALDVRILCVEYHLAEFGLRGMITAVRTMKRRGFDVVHVRRTDVTFGRGSRT